MTIVKKLFRLGVLALFLTACNQEFNSVGVDLIATDQFDTEAREFPVFVSVNNLEGCSVRSIRSSTFWGL